METLGYLIAGIFGTVIGAGVLLYAVKSIVKGIQRRSWLRTTGEIISEEVTPEDLDSTEADDTEDHSPGFVYRYRVNLIDYESSVITMSQSPFSGGIHIDKLISQHPQKNTVDVYYNPDNPAEATLQTGTSISGIALIIILGIPTFLCGLLFLFSFLLQLGYFPEFEF